MVEIPPRFAGEKWVSFFSPHVHFHLHNLQAKTTVMVEAGLILEIWQKIITTVRLLINIALTAVKGFTILSTASSIAVLRTRCIKEKKINGKVRVKTFWALIKSIVSLDCNFLFEASGVLVYSRPN